MVQSNTDSGALWRAYSYIGPTNLVIAGGAGPTSEFNLEYQNDWHPIGVMDEFANTQIIAIAQ